MYIKNIKLINFRNYFNLSLAFNKKINVFIGKNAQGKTNLLEAIYVCALGKSFKTNIDRELINFQKDEAYVAANISIDDYNRFIEVKFEKNRPKILRINKNRLDNNKELNSGLNVVVFSPEDLYLVKEGPNIRREFLDREISQIRPLYNYNISRYKKILYQRNNILKSNKTNSDKKDLLDIFDLQIAKAGSFIIGERRKYIKDLSKIANQIHKKVSNSNEELVLEYSSNVKYHSDLTRLEENYSNLVRENLLNDLETRRTSIGPHRDDMKIYVNGKDLRTYGSQGQQRTAVLSIKLSEVELIKQERGNYPVLLLDDVFSELDRERRLFLIKSLKNIQTIITVTDSLNLKEMEEIEKSIFHVESGRIKRIG